MDVESLSDAFAVRRLNAQDVEQIYGLFAGNKIFYRYHPPFVTRESILEDMAALPPGKGCEDKFFVGFFEQGELVAVMDLILRYPEADVCFIGLFMVDLKYQHRGIGSAIVQECMQRLHGAGFCRMRLGVDRGNPQSHAFWKKNGFNEIGGDRYILMEADLSASKGARADRRGQAMGRNGR